jgi:hypothetical protein
MNNFNYTNGAPVKLGDVVHVRNRAYYVDRFIGDHIMLVSMDDRREFTPVFPADIGARIANEHVHPTMRGLLPCLR